MDGPLGGRGSGRPPRRGRGAGGNAGNTARGGKSEFRRKLAGTPLFQPRSDNDDSADEGSKFNNNNKGKGAMAKDESLYDTDAEAARRSRFEKTASQNRYLELKPLREKERRDAIAAGLIPDPLKPRRLDEALTLQGVCEDMCPEFEREEREYQKNVDRWEMTPGTSRIDRNRAVTAFHRPAAGNEQPMPSDVRPPHILKKTLDYLFHDILAQDPEMTESHPFLRDRTRAVRQDFTLQNERGPLAIECHERIARYHILCLHVLREWENFGESQELEQLRKGQHIQSALRLQSLALRNNESRGERGRRPANSEASLNAFSRFFKQVAKDETSYLLACLAESHFTDIRRGALVAMRKAYIPQQPHYPIAKLAKMLGCNDASHCAEVAETFGLNVVRGVGGIPVSVELHKQVVLNEYPSVIKQRVSRTIVEVKRGSASIQSIINGEFYSSHVDLANTTKHLAKSNVVPQKSIDHSTTAFPSKARASPPISAPSTPGPQPAFTFKPSTSAFKLSAGASAFTPGSTLVPQGNNAFAAFKLPPSQSPASSSPATVPGISTKQIAVQEPARSPLQPRHVSPVAQQQAHTRKSSGRQPSITTAPAQPTSASRKTFLMPTPLPSAGKSALNKALPILLDMLLAEHVDSATRTAAIDSLTEIHAERAAVREADRQRVVEQCSAELLDKALDEFAAEKADYVAAAYSDSRITRQKHLKRWRRELTKAKQARKILQERKMEFGSLANHLGISPSRKNRPTSPVGELPDLSMLDISGGSVSTTSLRKASRIVQKTSSATFWTPKTLSSLICDQINQTFATFHTDIKPDWKCLIIVDSLDSNIATWSRCKLGVGASEEGSIVMLEHVRVEFSIVQKSEIDEQDLQDVGLVLINAETADGVQSTVEDIQRRLRRHSAYTAGVLLAGWAPDTKVTSKYTSQAIDTEDSNGGLRTSLIGMLQSVQPNNARQSGSSPRDLVLPFLDIWQEGVRRCLPRLTSSSSATTSAYCTLIEQFLTLLRDLNEELSDFVSFEEDEDSGPLRVPDFDASEDKISFSMMLQRYLGQPELQDNVSLAFLASNLTGIDEATTQVETFFESMADAFLQSYGTGRVTVEEGNQDILDSRKWYSEMVNDSVDSFNTRLSELSKTTGKKRRRSPLTAEISTTVVAQKRHRDDSPTKDTVKAPWMPERISSLSLLISQTKALLD